MTDTPFTQEATVGRIEGILKRRAARNGRTLPEQIAVDRQLFANSSLTSDCLDPFEVERLLADDLPEDRLLHVEDCPMCGALLEVARPSQRSLEVILDQVRKVATSSDRAVDRRHARARKFEPIVDAGFVIVPLCLIASMAFFVAPSLTSDVALKSVLHVVAIEPTLLVLAAGLMVMLTLYTISRYTKVVDKGWARRSGGAIAGSAFACLLVVVGTLSTLEVASNYEGLQTAQASLLAKLAKNDLNSSDQLLSIASPRFEGELVAEREKDLIKIFWIKNGRNDLATVYKGIVEQASGGNYLVMTSGPTIRVDKSHLSWTPVEGESVFALVPANSSEASVLHTTER